MKPRGETRGHLEPRLAGRAIPTLQEVGTRRAGIPAHRDGSPYPNPRHRGQSRNLVFFHPMENFFGIFPRYGKKFSTPWKTSPSVCRPQDVAPEDFFRALAGSHGRLSAVRRTWHQRISFGFGRGCFAEITGRFSDGGASQTTRAGLVSASGRPRSVHAEKMPVGFRAAQIQKKSSSPCPP
jgi:hypothetical protein